MHPSQVWMLLTSVLAVTSSCPGNGPTDNLRSVLIGRCTDFATVVNPSAVCSNAKQLDCASVTDTFIRAFAGSEACNVGVDRFQDFVTATQHDVPTDKGLFWKDAHKLVNRYAAVSQHKMNLEMTLTGYMADWLTFCADPAQPDGIGHSDSAYCPVFEADNCSQNAANSFWIAASENYASRVKGTVTVMLNASTSEAFSAESYFGKYELPNLLTGAVTAADIWLVSLPGHVVRERCDGDSVGNLQRLLSARGIPSTCTFNPREVVLVMCMDDERSSECQQLLSTGTSSAPPAAPRLPHVSLCLALLGWSWGYVRPWAVL